MYIRGKYPRQKTKPYRREIMKKKVTKIPKRARFARVKSGFLKKNNKASVAPPKPRLLKPL